MLIPAVSKWVRISSMNSLTSEQCNGLCAAECLSAAIYKDNAMIMMFDNMSYSGRDDIISRPSSVSASRFPWDTCDYNRLYCDNFAILQPEGSTPPAGYLKAGLIDACYWDGPGMCSPTYASANTPFSNAAGNYRYTADCPVSY